MPSSKRKPTECEEGEWEDITGVKTEPKDVSLDDLKTASPASQPSTPARRRRPATKTVYIASPRRTSVTPKPRSVRRTTQPSATVVSEAELQAALTQSVRSSAIYVHEVLVWFFYLLKRPLSILLVFWFVALILNSLSASLRAAFTPFCIIPGISRTPLCMRSQYDPSEHDPDITSARHADYPKMVEIQSKTFEQLLDDSVGSNGLALEIKKAEMATTDLVTLVRTSKLTSKELLANALVEFVNDARNTARGLQKLSAKVSGAVDNILAVNDYALRSIEASGSQKNSVMAYVWPFSLSRKTSSEELLTTTFAQSLSVLSASLARLVILAESSLHELDKLETQLATIHGILAREDESIATRKSELLAELWTRLGGNRAMVRGFNSNLLLLKELGSYRTRALAHVVAALQALQTLSADMEELRERVAAPELAGGEIPVEVHARSIRSGIERLNEGRLRAKQREEEAVQRILGMDGS